MLTREQVASQAKSLYRLQELECKIKSFENHLTDYATTLCAGVVYDCEHYDGGPPRSSRGHDRLLEIEKDSDEGKEILVSIRCYLSRKVEELKKQAGISIRGNNYLSTARPPEVPFRILTKLFPEGIPMF